MESFGKKSSQLFFRQIHVGKISALLNPVTYVIINLGIIAILWSGGNQVYLGRLTQGQVIALINYMSQILVELIKLANLIILLSKAIASLNRVNNIFDMQPSIKEEGAFLASKTPIGSIAGTAAVEFKNVSFSYNETAKEVLSNITFKAMPGQTIGIIGQTGAAKSTLVQLIPRLYDTTHGTVKVGGVDVRDYDIEALRDQVAMVLQKNVLFSGTIKENLRWGDANASDEELQRACELACADEFIQQMPDKYDTYIEQGGTNVSGGQKQRLCIARALLKKPKILILDDSTSAVDTKTDAKIRAALRTEIPETTKFIIAQRISSIQDADLILVLDGGAINGMGTHETLLSSNQIYQEVYYSQNRTGGADNG